MEKREFRAEVRDAGRSDLASIVEIWWRMVSEHESRHPGYWALGGESESKAAYLFFRSECFDSPSQVMVVAEVGGVVAGYAHGLMLERPPMYKLNPVGRINEVAVAPDFRRGGVGRALVEALTSRLVAMGMGAVELMVDYDNPGAQSLYRSLGFSFRQCQMIKMVE